MTSVRVGTLPYPSVMSSRTVAAIATRATIAQETGFGTASVMRHHFVKTLQISPLAYRRAFGLRLAS